jgi:thiamine-monophosphate kinase
MGEPPRLDERPFHRWIARTLTGPSRGLLPLGDDCAALPLGGKKVALLTTDALIEWSHFLPDSPPAAVGAAAASVSLSDLAAKGGRPVALTLDLLLPAETPVRWAQGVVQGADRTLRRFGAALVGGDTKMSRTPTVVGTLLGFGRSDRLVPRSSARPGDFLAVTGEVGRGGLAYQRFTTLGPHDRAALEALLAIEPRLPEGGVLARYAHAVLDTSDGVADGAHLLAEASKVRVEVEGDRLPLADGLDRGPGGELPAEAFFGGDYELLAAIAPGRVEAAAREIRGVGGTLTVIGRIAKGRGARLRTRAGVEALPTAGYRAFG